MWEPPHGDDMNRDAFSNCHPAVNFGFFIGAICLGVVIQHPAYIALSVVSATSYYLLLNGRKGLPLIGGLIPLFLLMTLINPLFNTQGELVLFYLFDRPYTAEAMMYGADLAGIFLVMMLWFGCYNAVLTGDKFTSLFGNLIPSLSLLLVMVLRLIPNIIRQAKQIAGARKSVGKGAGEQSTYRMKVNDGLTVLSALTSWALEGGVVTGDSMRSRGYGCAKRSSFQIYHMTGRDRVLSVMMSALLAVIIAMMIQGGTEATFTPELYIAPITDSRIMGLIAYGVYLSIPTVLHMKEAIQWHISRSKI